MAGTPTTDRFSVSIVVDKHSRWGQTTIDSIEVVSPDFPNIAEAEDYAEKLAGYANKITEDEASEA